MPDKQTVLKRLHAKAAAGIPIIGTGAGTGLTGKAEAEGGADLIIAYATGSFRMAGRSSLAGRFAASNANAAVLRMVDELIPLVGDTPVLSGVFVQDPFCNPDHLLTQLEKSGCAGVQNIPGMGGQAIMEGETVVRQLDAVGAGFDAEVDFVRMASRRGFLTTPYCSQPAHIEKMAKAGADIFVLHMGLTGRAEDKTMAVTPLEECAEKIRHLAEIAVALRPDALVLAHGGPIIDPSDLAQLMQRCQHLHGFYGASSIERIPVEEQVIGGVRQYKSLTLSQQQRSYEV